MTTTQQTFIETVWEYYAHHGRDTLPWRHGISEKNFAYKVLVSELMLQQTQVSRVQAKFVEWMERFPTIQTVANASFADCLKVWNGLGYNRRARYLYESCRKIVEVYQGQVPDTLDALVKLPGVGTNTAGAILAYAYNQPVLFIETNIRTVYIHHFFESTINVTDSQIVALLTETIDTDNPREWYWALMDYGSYLKKSVGNQSKNSAHYVKQSAFEGSQRQLRGAILRALQSTPHTVSELRALFDDDRLDTVLAALEKEQFITKTGVVIAIRS